MDPAVRVERKILRKYPDSKRKKFVVNESNIYFKNASTMVSNLNALKYIKDQLENFNPVSEGYEKGDVITLSVYIMEFEPGICVFDSRYQESLNRLDSSIDNFERILN